MTREELCDELIVKQMLTINTLRDALKDCVVELSYLIAQTNARAGGSVQKAYHKGSKALRDEALLDRPEGEGKK